MPKVLYPGRLQFRVAEDVRQAIDRAAEEARCGDADMCRRLILAGLKAYGVPLTPEPKAEA